MSLKVKVDEDLPAVVASILREAGYEALSVREQKMGGLKARRCGRRSSKRVAFLLQRIRALGISSIIRPALTAVC